MTRSQVASHQPYLLEDGGDSGIEIRTKQKPSSLQPILLYLFSACLCLLSPQNFSKGSPTEVWALGTVLQPTSSCRKVASFPSHSFSEIQLKMREQFSRQTVKGPRLRHLQKNNCENYPLRSEGTKPSRCLQGPCCPSCHKPKPKQGSFLNQALTFISFFNQRNSTHSLQINTKMSVNIFLITHISTIQRLPMVMWYTSSVLFYTQR